MYRTAGNGTNSRWVDSSTLLLNGDQFVDIFPGFEVAVGDADDISATAAHPWQSDYLIFADGSCCGTAAGNSSHIGNFY